MAPALPIQPPSTQAPPYTLWWLILCQLDWVMGCPDIWLNIILGVFVRVFLDEINIWISRLSKADCSFWWAAANPLKACIERKENVLSLLEYPWAGTSAFSCLWIRTQTGIKSLTLLVLRLWSRTRTIPLALLGLQLADCRSWDSWASITAWVHSL